MTYCNRCSYACDESDGKNQCMSTIGKRIKARREDLGLTQEDLATAVGIKQPSLCSIEGGKTKKLYADTLAGLCRELRVTFEYLFYGVGIAEDREVAVMEAELTSIVRQLPHEKRKIMVELSRALLTPPKSSIEEQEIARIAGITRSQTH